MPGQWKSAVFAAGQLGTAITHYGVVSFRESDDKIVGKGRFGCCDHFQHGGVGAGIADVVGYGSHKQIGFLGDDADVFPEVTEGNVPDVDPVDGDFAGIGS